MLSIRSDQGVIVHICHLIIEGSSPWVLGRNVTSKADIIYLNVNYLKVMIDETVNTLQLKYGRDHSFIDRSKFFHADFKSVNDPESRAICTHSASMTWKNNKRIVDRVHQHVCGHASFNDIKMLLMRNHIWNENCMKYLAQVLDTCENCIITIYQFP